MPFGLGMPRTGTSLTMGLLNEMGVHVGPCRKGKNNPNYYEGTRLFDYISKGEGSVLEVVELLDVAPKWGMKQPNIATRWDEFSPILNNERFSIHFVVTHRRNKDAQYKSHLKAIRRQPRDDFDERGKKYYDTVDDITENEHRIDVFFEDWFNQTKSKQMKDLADFAGLQVTQSALDLINPNLSKVHS